MDYGKVLSRAWQITWHWKVLWVLGFLAALGSGNGGGNFNFTLGGLGEEARGITAPGPEWIGLVIAVIALAFLIGIALWVVSIIASGGLVAGVQQVEDEESTAFGRAWRVGATRFWTLLAIRLLIAVAIIVPVLFLVGIIVLIAVAMGIGIAEGGPLVIVAGLGPVLCCAIPGICGLALLGAFLGLVQTYAERAAVLEELGAIDSLKRAWQVIRDNPGPTALMWLIFLGIGLALGFLSFLLIALTAAPIVVALLATEPAVWWIAPICGGGLLIFVLAAFVNGIVTTFTSAAWTLTYRRLAGLEQAAAEQPAEEAPSA